MGLLEFAVNFSSKKLEIKAGFKEADVWRYIEVNFPEALQNFADRICAEQRKFCAKKVFQNHLHGQSTFEKEMIAMDQPEIDGL
jgi:hypothetical protein